jgi:hypothetical protein
MPFFFTEPRRLREARERARKRGHSIPYKKPLIDHRIESILRANGLTESGDFHIAPSDQLFHGSPPPIPLDRKSHDKQARNQAGEIIVETVSSAPFFGLPGILHIRRWWEYKKADRKMREELNTAERTHLLNRMTDLQAYARQVYVTRGPLTHILLPRYHNEHAYLLNDDAAQVLKRAKKGKVIVRFAH